MRCGIAITMMGLGLCLSCSSPMSREAIESNSSAARPEERRRRAPSLALGRFHTCVLDLTGVKCWGANDFGQTDVPPLHHPSQVSAGGFHTCVLDDDGVKCWGHADYGQTSMPPLRHPRQLSAGGFHT